LRERGHVYAGACYAVTTLRGEEEGIFEPHCWREREAGVTISRIAYYDICSGSVVSETTSKKSPGWPQFWVSTIPRFKDEKTRSEFSFVENEGIFDATAWDGANRSA